MTTTDAARSGRAPSTTARVAAGVGSFAVALVAYVVVVHAHRDHLWYLIDLDVYRWGGETARRTTRLYQDKYDGFLSFTYPPIAAVIFMPLSYASRTTLKWGSATIGLASLVGAAWVAVRAGSPRPLARQLALAGGIAAVGLWLEPVQQTLRFGQINLTLMLLVLADLCRPDDRRTKGVGVGIAAGIKLTPVIFVVYLLLTRRVRAALVALAAFAATVALGFVVLPREASEFWFDRLFLDAKRVGGVAYVGNQSLHGAAVRIAGGVDAADPWWMLVALPVACTGLWLARTRSRDGRELEGVLLTALTGLLVSPISWSHHWVWAVPALALVVDHASARTGRARLVVPAALVLASAAWFFHVHGGVVLPYGLIWLVPFEQDREYHWNLLQMVIGNLYVVVGVGVLAALAWRDRSALVRDLQALPGRLRDAPLSARRSRGTTRRAALPGDHRPARSTQPTRAASGPGSPGR